MIILIVIILIVVIIGGSIMGMSLNPGMTISFISNEAFSNIATEGKQSTDWDDTASATDAVNNMSWNWNEYYTSSDNPTGVNSFSYDNHEVSKHDDFINSPAAMKALLDKKDADGEYIISDIELSSLYVTRDDFKAILQAVIDYNERVKRTKTITYEYYRQTWTKCEENAKDSEGNELFNEDGSHVKNTYYKWIESYIPVQKTFHAEDVEGSYDVDWQTIFVLATMNSMENAIMFDKNGNNVGAWENDDSDSSKIKLVKRIDAASLNRIIEAFEYSFYYLWDGTESEQSYYSWEDNSLEKTTYQYKETGDWNTPFKERSEYDKYGAGTTRTKQKIPYTSLAYAFNSLTGTEYEYKHRANSVGYYKSMAEDIITTTDVGSFVATCKLIVKEFEFYTFMDILESIGGPQEILDRYNYYADFYYEHQNAIDNNIASAMLVTTRSIRDTNIQLGDEVNDTFVRDIISEAGIVNDKKYIITEPDYARYQDGEGYNRTLKLVRGSIGDRITVDQLDRVIFKFCQRYNKQDSLLIGTGAAFIDAARNNGDKSSDPIAFLAIACHESAIGTSNIARTKYNFFGWKAYTNDPSQATDWKSNGLYDAIFTAVREINSNYTYRSKKVSSAIDQDTYWKMRWNNGVHQYCTDGDGSNGNPADNWPRKCNYYREELEKIAKEVIGG